MPTLANTRTLHATIAILRQLTESAFTQGIPTTPTTSVQPTIYAYTHCAHQTPFPINIT